VSHSPILIDLTELTKNPVKTGIQRVEREIIRTWPGPRPLAACRFDSGIGRFVGLPDAVLKILSQETTAPGEQERELLEPYVREAKELPTSTVASDLFNPEVFFDPARANAYRELCRQSGARVSWLVYDFLPFFRPQDYPIGTPRSCMPYFQAVREVPRVSFISKSSRSQYISLVRKPERAGPYFPLGGDGLQMEKQTFSPSRLRFAYIGTIEPRKNVAVILEAFERLWREGANVELTVVGRLDSRSTREIPILERLGSERRFNYLGHASDALIRDVLREARATLFVSEAEGFGIPPFEHLAAGIPVIVSKGLPSTELLPPGGRVELPVVTASAIGSAVRELLDDEVALRLWTEAGRLAVPTWAQLTKELATWLHEA
jgi:glycosyltransferase involved in cell wall biosynthesis